MLLIKTTMKLAPVGHLGRQEGDDLCSVLPLPPVVSPDVAQGLSGTGLSDVPIHSAASSKWPYWDLSLAVPFTMVQDHIWFHLVRLLSPGAHWSPVQIYILIRSQTRENVEHPFKGVPCCQLKDAFESKKEQNKQTNYSENNSQRRKEGCERVQEIFFLFSRGESSLLQGREVLRALSYPTLSPTSTAECQLGTTCPHSIPQGFTDGKPQKIKVESSSFS